MAIYKLNDAHPHIGAGVWVAENASVIGRVSLGDNVNVWYGAVIRGDNEGITIGRDSNVQEGAVLHTDAGIPLAIGERVTVGHQVMLHGCTVGDESLIGIQAVVLNRARIGRRSIVGAGALVTEGKSFPDGALIVGSPAKVARMLTEEEQARLRESAAHYVANAARHRIQLERID